MYSAFVRWKKYTHIPYQPQGYPLRQFQKMAACWRNPRLHPEGQGKCLPGQCRTAINTASSIPFEAKGAAEITKKGGQVRNSKGGNSANERTKGGGVLCSVAKVARFRRRAALVSKENEIKTYNYLPAYSSQIVLSSCQNSINSTNSKRGNLEPGLDPEV